MSSQDGRAGSDASAAHNPLLVYVFQKVRVVGTRKNTYQATIQACRDLFPSIPRNRELSLHTSDLDVCDGQLSELSTEVWPYALPQLNSVTAKLKDSPRSQALGPFHLCFSNANHTSTTCRVQPNTPVATVIEFVGSKLYPGTCNDDLQFTHDGVRLALTGTIADWFVDDGDEIFCQPLLRGGKPVVYLFSPKTVEASVHLSLVPQWELSAIYPVVPIKAATQQCNQQVSWHVKVHSNGQLTELSTGLDVSYLFWEAHTIPKLLDSPPPSPTLQAGLDNTTENFIPNNAVLADENSVMLPVDTITPYIDATLKVLGLHTEARTSFITYWLPSFLKHKHVALRFLPQAAYEKAAPLDVSPTPDLVTRVFMLFKGVKDEDLVVWSSAQAKAEDDVLFWAETVGVDISRTLDKHLFRVVEWGGMEVV
ncbi:hypothetical protein CPB83DRAFT_860628 [Crepidotus variabilis]|uniref:Uncharacterized protein n=1 Tax=Crepidotus variabilis TaxID=179855 RepID=A0A9P6JLM2_9AGAR|nr:hypothetical protein CPB83DRAFT_860628 [Crepidotus variabilis]